MVRPKDIRMDGQVSNVEAAAPAATAGAAAHVYESAAVTPDVQTSSATQGTTGSTTSTLEVNPGSNVVDARINTYNADSVNGFQKLLDESQDPVANALAIRAMDRTSNPNTEKLLPVFEQIENPPNPEIVKKLQDLLLETIPRDDQAKYDRDVAALKGEQMTGTYGETTRRLFTDLMQRLEGNVLPEYLRQLQSRQLTVPAGAPQFMAPPVPLVDGQMVPVDLHSPAVQSPGLRADLQIDTSKAPTETELKKLTDVYTWLQLSRNQLAEADGKTIDNLLIRQINAEGLPATWLPREGDDRDKWRTSVANLLDSIFQTKKYAEEVRLINEVRFRSGQTPLPYPPAVQSVDKDGNIIYRDDFPPKDPRLDSSAKYLNELAAWQKDWGEVADYLALKVAVAKANPATLLTWGRLPMQDKQAVFDKDGKFIDFVKDDGSYVPKDGETIQKFNLLDSKFEVTERVNDKGEKEIVVKQNVQAQQVPWYGYQNAIYENVGQPFQQEYVFKPDEFVPVQSNNGLMLVQAKDLARFRSGQQLDHYIHIGISVTADVGMLALLGPEVKGLQLAYSKMGQSAVELAAKKVGTEVAELGVLTSTEVLLQTGKTSLRALAAASGILNNAGGMDTMWGRMLLEFRGLYYMADMGTGLMRLPLLNPSTRFTQQMIEGNGSKLLNLLNSTGHALLKVAEPAMVLTSGQDLLKRVAGLLDLNSKNPLDQFKDPVNQSVEPITIPQGNGKLELTPELLGVYKAILQRNGNADSSAKVNTIFDTMNALLAGKDQPGNAEQRKAYVEELLAPERFSEEDIIKLNRMVRDAFIGPFDSPHRVPLTATDLAVLWSGRLPTDAELKQYYPDGNRPTWLINPYVSRDMIAEAQRMKLAIEQSESPEVRTARRLAALVLSAGPDGTLPQSLDTSIWAAVTHYGAEFPRETTRGDLNFQKLPFQVSTKELTDALQVELTRLKGDTPIPGAIATSKNGDGLVLGDMLLRMGLTTKEQYAQTLQSIIESPQASKQDKIDALLGNGTIGYGTILGAIIEERLQAASRLDPTRTNYGSDTADFLRPLSATASNREADADVRAAAAVLLFIERSDVEFQKAMLPRIKDLWQQSKDKPAGTFADAVTMALRDVATNVKTSPSQMVNAAKVLMELGGDNNKLAAGQALITAATASETVADMNSILQLLVRSGPPGDEASVLAVLKRTNPEFAQSFLTDTIDSISKLLQSSPFSTINVKKNIPALITVAKDLAVHGSDDQRAQLSQSLRTMYASSAPMNTPEDVDARRMALVAISDLEGDKSVELLKQIVTDAMPTLSDVTGAATPSQESSAAIRILALTLLDGYSARSTDGQAQLKQILETMNPANESDPVYRQLLTELRTKYGVTEMPEVMPPFLSNSSVLAQDKQQMADWIKKFFPLLDPSNFERMRKAAEDSLGFFDWAFNSQAGYEALIEKALEPAKQARQAQFDMLLQQAFQTSTDPAAVEFSKKAKAVLYSILMFNQPTGADGKQQIPAGWQKQAAEALVAAMAPGELGQSLAKGYVSQALLSGTLSPEIQQILISGWIKSAKPQSALETNGPIGSSSSYIEYLNLLNKTLENAMSTQTQNPSAALSQLITTLESARREVMLAA